LSQRACPVPRKGIFYDERRTRFLLILVLIIGIGLFGPYKSAHAVNRTGRWLINAAEGTPSSLTSCFWAGVRIFHESKTAEKLFPHPDGFNFLLVQTSERTNVGTCGSAQSTFEVWNVRPFGCGKITRQSGIGINNVEIHTDVGNNGLSLAYVRIHNLYSDGLIRAQRDKPYMLDYDLGPMGSDKFFSSEAKRITSETGLPISYKDQHDGKEGDDSRRYSGDSFRSPSGWVNDDPEGGYERRIENIGTFIGAGMLILLFPVILYF
jgi:hypothetical protein